MRKIQIIRSLNIFTIASIKILDYWQVLRAMHWLPNPYQKNRKKCDLAPQIFAHDGWPGWVSIGSVQ